MKIPCNCARICRGHDGETGSALILALLVVLVVGSGLAVALDYIGVGLTIAPTVRDDRNESNYIQGAVEGAINQIRGSSEAGQWGDDSIECPEFAPTSPAGLSGVSGRTFRVTCDAQDPGSAFGLDQPRFVIHALGDDVIHTSGTGTQGIRQVAGNEQLYIDGGIYSHGVVSVGGGSGNSMRINGTVIAHDSCTPKVTSTDVLGLRCGSSFASSAGDDPNYGSSIPDAAALTTLIDTGVQTTGADPVPTCSSSGTSRITFEPGYYGTRPDLLVSKLASSCASTSLWHFKPGRYYFDYEGIWSLDSHKVVGGTLSSTPSDLSAACDESAAGVQFIFGGASQISTKSSAGGNVEGIELCGPLAGHTLNGAPQRIVLYGQKTGALPGELNAIQMATTNPSPSAGWTAPTLAGSLARTIDAQPAIATLSPNSTVTMSYGVLPSTPIIPKGAKISAVNLRISHTLIRASATVRLQTPGMTSPVSVSVPACVSCSVPLTDLLTADVLWRMLAELSVTYEARGNSGNASQPRAASLDGLQLEVAYTAPTLTAQTCDDTCDYFFQSENNPNVFMHGTVYTPEADWFVTVHNSGETIFERGIVLRDIAITMNSSSKQETSPFQLPSGTPFGRLVLFRGYADEDGPGGDPEVEKVRACVRYVDKVTNADGTTSAYAGWSLTIPRWLVMRTPSTQTASCG